MWEGRITRDPDEMYKFVDFVEDYSERVKRVCREMEDEMDMSSAYLNDDISKKGVQKTKNLIDELRNGLPVIKEAAEKVKKSADWLRKAESIQL
ncbi:MAG: hypothetical protein LBS00_07450 [Synergistaceae bacterium]|jgi:hypothetical protein|nr:hypothetical protein [Synergistaceae bacterium]